MKTILISLIVALAGVASAASATCSTWAEMSAALLAGNDVVLTGNIEQGDNAQIALNGDLHPTLDLNGYTISGSENAADDRRCFAVGSGVSFTICDTKGGGLIDGRGVTRNNRSGGGFLRTSDANASFVLKGGTIANFGTTLAGGAIDVGAGTVRIEGGMITNCVANDGGGIRGMTTSSVTMSGGKIVGCSANYGGGIRMYGGRLTLTGGEVAYNSSYQNGNGINCDGFGGGAQTFTMTGGKIHHNTDKSSGSVNKLGGGGILLWDKMTATISGGEIYDNETAGKGGGLLFRGTALTVSGGEIRGNTATDGGGISIGCNKDDNLTVNMTGGRIESNTCTRCGGGVYVYMNTNDRLNVSGGEIVGNANLGTASGADAGAGGGICSSGLLTLTGGVVSNNTATLSGAAVYTWGSASQKIAQKISGGIIDGAITASSSKILTIDGGLFDRDPGYKAAGYAATALPNVAPTRYLVGKGVGFANGGLSSGSMGFNPTEHLYKEAGVTMAEGCHVTRSGTGYAVISVSGTPLSGYVNEAIAFHGFLTEPDGTKLTENSVVKIDFKLYPSANAGAELLWARRIPVTIDQNSGYYIDIADGNGQSYQAPGGVKPTCATLRAALARHAQLSSGPLWLAYEPVVATVATPFPRVPLYYQPLAQRASTASTVTVASVGTVEATDLKASDASTVTADRLVVDTELLRLNGLSFEQSDRDVSLNASGAVKIRNVTGLACSAATNTLGALAADLPATADSDCGRVVKRVVNGAETLAAIYYSKGEATTLPEGSTNVYVWSFGPLVQKAE